MTLVAFDHKMKEKCILYQVTDYEVDRVIIDRVEAWHKEKHQEIFYRYEPNKVNESRKGVKKQSYIDLIMKEITEKDLKTEP